MTKKDLIEFLKNYPDDTNIRCYTPDGFYDAIIEEDVCYGEKSVVITGDFYETSCRQSSKSQRNKIL